MYIEKSGWLNITYNTMHTIKLLPNEIKRKTIFANRFHLPRDFSINDNKSIYSIWNQTTEMCTIQHIPYDKMYTIRRMKELQYFYNVPASSRSTWNPVWDIMYLYYNTYAGTVNI